MFHYNHNDIFNILLYLFIITHFYLSVIIYFETALWFKVFLYDTKNYMVSSNYFYLIIVISLHTVTWFQVINDNNPL